MAELNQKLKDRFTTVFANHKFTALELDTITRVLDEFERFAAYYGTQECVKVSDKITEFFHKYTR